MTPVQSTVVTTASMGRLPERDTGRPLSARGFGRLAQQFRGAGLWLSLWNRRGECVEVDEQGGRLWDTFWTRGQHFRDQLAALARTVCEADADPQSPPKGAADPLSLWRPDLAMIATRICRRRRSIGAVVGVAVTSPSLGEAFTRLCGMCALDSQATASAAADTRVVKEEWLSRLPELLRASVEQTRELEDYQEELEVLTRNLENTYEEQHLVYHISSMMALPQKPADMLRRVAGELLAVSRAAGLGFVISERACAGSAVDGAAEPLSCTLQDRVVQIGRAAPGLPELDRLAECVDLAAADSGFVLLNDATQRPGIEWAAPWLQHLVVLPLRHEQRVLGAMLAINCTDAGDFTSVDVQLLQAVADRVAAFLENQRLYDDVAHLLMGMLHALVNSIDAKDQYTCGHSERVAIISRALAQAVGLSVVDAERVYLAGLLHDVGKIGVPDAILCKPGKLTVEEFEAMKRHPEIGARILSRVQQIADLTPGILHHHERADGRGYPHGLPGKTAPLVGRIICLADCFDAMTTDRTYRPALPLSTAVSEVRRCAGTQFDAELAERFLRLDLRQLMKEARECSVGDPTISHIGALNAYLKDIRHGEPQSLSRTGVNQDR